jgi:predicted protein tyrosine phosphatase
LVHFRKRSLCLDMPKDYVYCGPKLGL